MPIPTALVLMPAALVAAALVLMTGDVRGPLFPAGCALLVAALTFITLLRTTRASETGDVSPSTAARPDP